jgi:hypothetical protein
MSDKINKSAVIREVAAANPTLGPTAVANLCLEKHGVQVSAAHVNQALGKNKPAADKPAKSTAPAKATVKVTPKPAVAAKASAVKSTAPKQMSKTAATALAIAQGRGPVSPVPVKSVKSTKVAACTASTTCSAVDTINAGRALIDLAGGVEQAKAVLDAIRA